MSFGLGRGRQLEPGEVGLTLADLPPMPDVPAEELARVGPGESPPAALLLDPRGLFPDPARPFELEIGSGKGTFILEESAARPDTNFLGVEWAREFYLYAADRCRRRALANVRLLNADATELIRWRTPSSIVRVLHLYFSDPWPKSRHHKRRVVQDRFLADAWRILEPGGELRIVTDHEDYWTWMEEHFARWCAPGAGESTFGLRYDRVPFGAEHRPTGAGEGELVGSNFERKYTREGRPFHATVLRKPESANP